MCHQSDISLQPQFMVRLLERSHVHSWDFENYQPTISSPVIFVTLFRFEKMISGMYLGEIARVVCMELIQNKLLFNGQAGKFSTKDSFQTKFVSDIER